MPIFLTSLPAPPVDNYNNCACLFVHVSVQSIS